MDDQTRGMDPPGSDGGFSSELAAVQQAIAANAAYQLRLDYQRHEALERLERYRERLRFAQAANAEGMAREMWDRCQELQDQLGLMDRRFASLQAEREELLAREAHLAAQFAPPDPRTSFREWSPFTSAQTRPARRRSLGCFAISDRLLVVLCALAVIILLAPLVLVRLLRAAPPQSAPAALATSQLPTVTPTPNASPAFTPAGTAPTSQDCKDTLSYACYSPEQMQGAFHLNALYNNGLNGRGQTIVILGAGHSAHLKQDLHQFDLAWGLPDPPSFQILQPLGPPAPYDCPFGEDDLEIENTLDVEWSHAIAPGANIVLLIWSNGLASDPPDYNCGMLGLEDGVAYALDHQLGQVISISYGGSELGDLGSTAIGKRYNPQTFAKAHEIFKRAAAQHVTVLAAAGDTGVVNFDNPTLGTLWQTPDVSWPASDPYVLAVGGTTIEITDAAGTVDSEQVWNDQNIGGATGGGLSSVFPEPDYQKQVPDQTLLKGKRGIPDVAFPAEVNYALYLSDESGPLAARHPQWQHWDIIGGTSASTPCWAGLIAIADQMEGSSLGFIHPALYALHGQGMNDITLGDNSYGGIAGYHAGPGYDLVTGWGTPIADQFIPALLNEVNRIAQVCQPGQRVCS